ncbi:MAG: hypothetical protein IQL11_12915 [Bacteroidales bacterium]|nr:hypothetical protein [Bacteroidales bacterium]
MPVIPIENQIKFIAKFARKRKLYVGYARLIEKIFRKAVNLYAPLSIVQSRAKTVASFSEKIIRKDKYKDPLAEMTDLCGVRIITHFENQTAFICRFIEKYFNVDNDNSVDVKTRLKVGEFGYRSLHYVISPGKERIFGFKIPKDIKHLKAEIQVRTLNEHTWADILHDRIYKTTIKVPEHWQRESARLAAMLEEIDNSFMNISNTLDQYSLNYRPTPPVAKTKDEINILQTLIKINPSINNETIINYLKLTSIYNMLGQWEAIEVLLHPVMNQLRNIKACNLKCRVKYEAGFALCMKNRDSTDSNDFSAGINLINQSLRQLKDNPAYHLEISNAYSYLARCYAMLKKNPSEMSALYNRAHEFTPDNPYYHLASVFWQIAARPGITHEEIERFKPYVRTAISTLRDHIELGVETVNAYIYMCICNFLCSNKNEDIHSCIDLMDIIFNDIVSCSSDTLVDGDYLIRSLSWVNPFKAKILSGILNLIIWKKFKTKKSRSQLRFFKHTNFNPNNNILILAGDSRISDNKTIEKYGEIIYEALFEFEGNVIYGGTNQGVPGLVEAKTYSLKANNKKKYSLYAYLPRLLQQSTGQEKPYDYPIESKSDDFSYHEVLNYWTDIILSKVNSNRVILIGLNGGDISSMEYKTALALGAKVALVSGTGGSAEKINQDPKWNAKKKLLITPNDPFTIWALTNQNRKTTFKMGEVTRLARKVHKEYRIPRFKRFKADEVDINKFMEIMPWNKLNPGLKSSNKKQVEFMEFILKRVGLSIKKISKPIPFKIPENLRKKTDFEYLASLEHGRWNAERLLAGWRYGKEKDIINKLNPCLLSWNELSNEVKKWDFDNAAKFAEHLALIGYKVYYPKLNTKI